MHQLREHLLVVYGACALLPLAGCRVEVIDDECGRRALACSVSGVLVARQNELPWLPCSVTLQVCGVDRDNACTSSLEVRPNLEALSVARSAEDAEDKRPAARTRQVEDQVLVELGLESVRYDG